MDEELGLSLAMNNIFFEFLVKEIILNPKVTGKSWYFTYENFPDLEWYYTLFQSSSDARYYSDILSAINQNL